MIPENIEPNFEIHTEQDLLALQEVLEEYKNQDETFQNNPYLLELYHRISLIKDLSKVSEEVRNSLLALFTKGLSTSHLPILNNLKNKKEIVQLMENEQKLLDPNLSDDEKINLIYSFKNQNAIPDSTTLDHLLASSSSLTLKKTIFLNFGAHISQEWFINILQNRNQKQTELRSISIQVSHLRSDLPTSIFEQLIIDPTEDIYNRILCLEIYNTKISANIFSMLILNKTEKPKLRLLAIKKGAIRFDLNLDFILTLLLSQNESLSIKKAIILSFKNRLPIDYIRRYLLDKTISIEEKFEILKLIENLFPEINKNGTLDILFLLMKEFSAGRQLLLKSNALSEICIKQLLFDKKTSPKIKEDILTYCEKELSKKNYKEILTEIVTDPNTPMLFRIEILSNFQKLINTETIIHIILNESEPTDFRLAVMDKFKTKIKEQKKAKELEILLLNDKLPIKFKNYLLKFFYTQFSDLTVSSFLLKENLFSPNIQNLLLSLKKVNFLTEKSIFFKEILKIKHKNETYKFLFTYFKNYFDSPELYILLKELSNQISFEQIIDSLIKENPTRIDLLKYILKKLDSPIEIKIFILKNYSTYLSGAFLGSLLADPDYPFKLKKIIIQTEPKREDINDGGELEFIFSDKEESSDIRALIYQHYKHLLNESVIRSVKSNKSEDKHFLKKIAEI